MTLAFHVRIVYNRVSSSRDIIILFEYETIIRNIKSGNFSWQCKSSSNKNITFTRYEIVIASLLMTANRRETSVSD